MTKQNKIKWLLWGISFVGLALGVEGLVKVWSMPSPILAIKMVAVITFIVSSCSLGLEALRSRSNHRLNFYTGSPCAFLALATIERLLPRHPALQVIDYQQGLNIFMCLGSAGVALFIALLPEPSFERSNLVGTRGVSSGVTSSGGTNGKNEPR